MDENGLEDEPVASQTSRGKTRDLVAFWIFGLCNNYGYVVMLTAAIDIINSDGVSQIGAHNIKALTFLISVNLQFGRVFI